MPFLVLSAISGVFGIFALICLIPFVAGVGFVISDNVLHRTLLWWKRGAARLIDGVGQALLYALIGVWFASCSTGMLYRPF